MSYNEEQLYADEYRNDYLKQQRSALLTLAWAIAVPEFESDAEAEHAIKETYAQYHGWEAHNE